MVRRLTTPLSGGQIRRHRELTALCGGTCASRLIALEGIDVNLEVDVAARSARTLHGWWEGFGAEWFQPSLANFDPRTNSLDLLAAHPPLVDQ